MAMALEGELGTRNVSRICVVPYGLLCVADAPTYNRVLVDGNKLPGLVDRQVRTSSYEPHARDVAGRTCPDEGDLRELHVP